MAVNRIVMVWLVPGDNVNDETPELMTNWPPVMPMFTPTASVDVDGLVIVRLCSGLLPSGTVPKLIEVRLISIFVDVGSRPVPVSGIVIGLAISVLLCVIVSVPVSVPDEDGANLIVTPSDLPEARVNCPDPVTNE